MSVNEDVSATATGEFVRVTMDAPALDYEYPDIAASSIAANVPTFPFGVRKIGQFVILKEKKLDDGKMRFDVVVGPCWPMFCFTVSLVVGIPIVAAILFYPRLGGVAYPWLLAGIILVVVTVVALCKTGCSDPGIQPRAATPIDDSWIWNDRVGAFAPRGSQYCSDAGAVIEDVDHFCPWTGTTIAKKNMCCFKVFTSSVCMLCIFTVIFCMVAAR